MPYLGIVALEVRLENSSARMFGFHNQHLKIAGFKLQTLEDHSNKYLAIRY